MELDAILDEMASEKKRGIPSFRWDDLIGPYRKGGSQDRPVVRSWGTIIRWLVRKHRFDVDIVGAAILIATLEMRNGKEFKGDGTYGSEGKEMVYHLKGICISLKEKKAQALIFEMLGEKIYNQIEPVIARKLTRSLLPWYKRIIPLWLSLKMSA